MTDDLRQQFADYRMLQDYHEFLDSYFLQVGDEPGALSHDETDQLTLFYTMYSSLSDDSGGFEDVLDSLCNKNDEYNACTDDSDRLEQRDAIRSDVLAHLRDGLERCGQDRSEILEGTNGCAVDDGLTECHDLIDEIDAEVDPDEVDIESTLDEARSSVDDLDSMLSPSSWFGEWEKHKYAIDAFVDCLQQLENSAGTRCCGHEEARGAGDCEGEGASSAEGRGGPLEGP